eukprot:scaffold194427_cov40-Tisochrysis_lutea.AAC.3
MVANPLGLAVGAAAGGAIEAVAAVEETRRDIALRVAGAIANAAPLAATRTEKRRLTWHRAPAHALSVLVDGVNSDVEGRILVVTKHANVSRAAEKVVVPADGELVDTNGISNECVVGARRPRGIEREIEVWVALLGHDHDLDEVHLGREHRLIEGEVVFRDLAGDHMVERERLHWAQRLTVGSSNRLVARCGRRPDVAQLPARLQIEGVAPCCRLSVRIAAAVVPAKPGIREVEVLLLMRPRPLARLGDVDRTAVVGRVALRVALIMPMEAVVTVPAARGHVAHLGWA